MTRTVKLVERPGSLGKERTLEDRLLRLVAAYEDDKGRALLHAPQSIDALWERVDGFDWVPAVKGRNWEEEKLFVSVVFAAKAWLALFDGLTMRRLESKHPFDSPEGMKVVSKITNLYAADGVRAVKWLKAQTTALSALALGQQELPQNILSVLGPNDRPGILGPGWISRLCRRLINGGKQLAQRGRPNARSRVQLSFGLDVLMSKTGAPSVDSRFVSAAMDEHLSLLTTVQPSSPDQAEWLARVEDRIVEMCHTMFKGVVFEPDVILPSTSASLNYSREMGGSFMELVDGWLASTVPAMGPEESPAEQPPAVLLWDVRREGIVGRTRIQLPGIDFVPSFQRYIDSKIVPGERVGARRFAIVEPFKVRVITMQDPAVTLRAAELQVMVHRRLKSFSAFQYIGEPISDQSFGKHFPRPLEDDEMYLSGDYAGATDNLNPRLSVAAARAIAESVKLQDGRRLIETAYWDVYVSDLVRHRFFSGAAGSALKPEGDQEWGQMMGSPSSFPILCIVNAAVNSVVMGITTPDVLFRDDCGLVVNGDDTAAVLKVALYPSWKAAVSACGLRPSLGKNYLSHSFCIMNSEARVPETHKAVGEGPAMVKWTTVGGLNQALLTGYEKKGPGSGRSLKGEMAWTELGARAHELVSGIPEPVADRWLSRFIAEHKQVFAQVPAGTPWFVSRALGGVGLPLLPSRASQVSEQNLRFAALISCLPEDLRERLTSWPKRRTSSWLDRQLAASEEYYEKYFPSHYNVRNQADSTLEQWGFGGAKETNSLGAYLRLGFVLDQAVSLHRRRSVALPDLIPSRDEALGSGGQIRAAIRHYTESADGPAGPVEELFLFAVGRTRKNRDYAKACWARARMLFKYVKLSESTSLSPMGLAKAVAWQCPLYKVIDYQLPSIGTVRMRFDSFVESRCRVRSRRLPVVKPVAQRITERGAPKLRIEYPSYGMFDFDLFM